MTPLHISAMEGHVDVLEYLLDHRADINIQDDEGCTALDKARRNKRTACVQVLEARLKSPGKILLVYLYLLYINIDI